MGVLRGGGVCVSGAVSGTLRALGDPAQSHGSIPTPGLGAPHKRGTPLLPFPEGWAPGWGSSRGQGRLEGLPGAPSRVLKLPELPPHRTHADPKTASGLPHSRQPPALFPRLDRGVFPEIASLPGNTGCCEDGRQQPLHPRAIPRLSQSPSSALFLPGRSMRNSEGTELELRVLQEI